ncbi:dynamin family protein [Rhodococcus sp. NPDC058521]|uniref:dynamin family protein n=1 Tax=Rhodococcus sp. NPDC058521 TaxID=3346536 RepID=UPI00365A76D7
MTAIATTDRTRDLIATTRRLYEGNGHVLDQLSAGAERLDQPLRIALAGSLKAGKSTLLNALVGQSIAPTDATECTRIVTWFRHGSTPSVTARCHDGAAMNVPVRRVDGHLTFDLGTLTSAAVDRIDVGWPASTLSRTTLIDTPGTSSLSREVSARTLRLLTPESGAAEADAVVYLFRTLTDTDVAFLRQIAGHVGGQAGPLGVIGVIGRADELGSGRLDAMHSARDVAKEVTRELELTGLCQTAVPVAGLLALSAKTLRQSDFLALRKLTTVTPEDMELSLLSSDRFERTESPLPLDARVRGELIRRFGLFGIRMALTQLRLGVADSPTLADRLLARSGLSELESVIDIQFGQRSEDLKVHTALELLRRIYAEHPNPRANEANREVTRLLKNVHGFQELRMLGKLRSVKTRLSRDELDDLQRVLGAFGTGHAERLGLEPFAVAGLGREVALAQVQLWRERAEHPLADQFTAAACLAAARSAEGVLSELRKL